MPIEVQTGVPGPTGPAGGLVSLNGDATDAQTIAAGAGITVTDVGATHTVAATGIVANPAPATGRGVLIQLGKANVNLNAAVSTTIFTTPGSGFTRCVVLFVIVDNFSGTPPLSAAVTLGAAATPDDWSESFGIGASANDQFAQINNKGAVEGASAAVYGTGVAFVVAVTTPAGAAYTGDVSAWGYYE